MLASLTVIVLFEVAGDALQALFRLPIPGPVIGMALLFAALIGNGKLPPALDRTASGLLGYLPMLFVPAGVGVMAHFDLLRAEWPAIVAALLVSSVAAVVVTGLTMRAIERTQQAVRDAAGNRTAVKRSIEGAQ